ncbi:uncharacterized protein JCM15063_005535 [Sporobolomyces koalae]|uniref:uncharacterized protein n=1 Tax=Sporobolomyces koalae TaxID=500713 RepID=UPI00317BC9B3
MLASPLTRDYLSPPATTIATILLQHYASVAVSRVAPSTDQPLTYATSDDEDADTRSIQTGIKEARDSIARKDDKLRWLLGDNFEQGPNGKPRAETAGSSTTLRSARSSAVRSSEEASSTVSALPDFPPRATSLSEQRGSVDSCVTVDTTHQRHSRLISTSSSTAPLLSSTPRPSTTSIGEDPARPTAPGASRRRVVSLGVNTSDAQSPGASSTNGAPTPPLQSLDSPSRPFAYLRDLSPSASKRFSLDSAKDDLKNGRRESIPLDCQELTIQEKSELVRRNKKLEKLLGSQVGTHAHEPRRTRSEEETGAGIAERRSIARPVSIQIPSVQLGALSSSTAISPTTDCSPTSKPHPTSDHVGPSPRTRAPHMYRSSSTPSYSPLASPTSTSPFSPALQLSRTDSSSLHPTVRLGRNGSHLGSNRAIDHERDERRKKLDKVRRVLGERVPLGLVVQAKPQLYEYEHDEHLSGTNSASTTTATTASTSKGKSRHMGERLKEVFVKADTGKKASGSTKWHQHDRENWMATPSANLSGGERKMTNGNWDGPAHSAGLQGVEALTKARKLESLFGDLPPSSLYLAPSTALGPVSASRRSRALVHRRSQSDLGTRSSSVSTASSGYDSADKDLDLYRARSLSSSAHSYRRSIASLRYVIEQDPSAFDEVVRVYTQRDDPFSSELDLSLPNPHTSHSSTTTTSHAAVRKAQKLSSFFGTTKGEVWKALLDDLATAIGEDDELESEEKEEVLQSLGRLRVTTEPSQQQ